MSEPSLILNKITGEGWRSSYFVNSDGSLPPGGIVLQKTRHESYNLANDIRVIKIWLDEGLSTESSVTLGTDDFEPAKPVSILTKADKPPFPFGEYKPKHCIKAVFESINPVIPGGSKLKIVQTYILTEYSSNPAHEPSGSLSATRLFPLIQFSFPDENANTPTKSRVKTIRVDYRFDFNLDVFLHGATIEESFKKSPRGNGKYPTPLELAAIKKQPQQAGVFRDSDTARPILEGIFPEDVVFKSAEKPLVSEIISEGLDEGLNKTKNIFRWDNIHWWGGYKAAHIPSTPGAFHAIHLHWRWGLSLQEKPFRIFGQKLDSDPEFSGQPQFKGTSIGGPLLDSSISKQTIQFAIVKNELLPQDILQHSTAPFAKIFKLNKGNIPVDIKDGSDLVLYLSCTAKRQNDSRKFTGTFFIHGLFFAHDKEIKGFTIGSKDREYFNPKNPNPILWERYPSK